METQEIISHAKQHKNLGIIVTLLLVVGVFTTILANSNELETSIIGSVDKNTYQAIHIDNGETYFGKIKSANEEKVEMVSVYYFLDESKKKLVKRGKEAYGPDGVLTLNRNHVISTENLSEDSKVLQAIRAYEAK